jgi:hypothetical protein
MFRASTNAGNTFGDKINLSNSTKSDSQDAHIDASGDRVFVTWWERDATSNEPVLSSYNELIMSLEYRNMFILHSPNQLAVLLPIRVLFPV